MKHNFACGSHNHYNQLANITTNTAYSLLQSRRGTFCSIEFHCRWQIATFFNIIAGFVCKNFWVRSHCQEK